MQTSNGQLELPLGNLQIDPSEIVYYYRGCDIHTHQLRSGFVYYVIEAYSGLSRSFGSRIAAVEHAKLWIRSMR